MEGVLTGESVNYTVLCGGRVTLLAAAIPAGKSLADARQWQARKLPAEIILQVALPDHFT
jgi:hypothetical protein